MAQERATILAHALDDARIDLTPIRDRRSPVEAPSDVSEALPEPSAKLRTFRAVPLPAQMADDGSILEGFSSLRPGAKRQRMVPYPIRLPAEQIAELERLREERGIIPAEFIRDAVAGCLALLRKA